MLRWFSDFDHIISYVAVKLFILSLLFVVMWILIDRHLYLDAEQISMLHKHFIRALEPSPF